MERSTIISRREWLRGKGLLPPVDIGEHVSLKSLAQKEVTIPVVCWGSNSSEFVANWLKRCLPQDPAYSKVTFGPVNIKLIHRGHTLEQLGEEIRDVVGDSPLVVIAEDDRSLHPAFDSAYAKAEKKPAIVFVPMRELLPHAIGGLTPQEATDEIKKVLAAHGIKPKNAPKTRPVVTIPVFCVDTLGQSVFQIKELTKATEGIENVAFVFKPMPFKRIVEEDRSFTQRGSRLLREATGGCPAVIAAAVLHSREGYGLKEVLEKAYEGHEKPPDTLFVPFAISQHPHMTVDDAVKALVRIVNERK